MKRILLLGAAGQVGQELAQVLPVFGTVTEFDRSHIDIIQPEVLRQAIAQVHPDVIVNASAYTAVDRAEQEPDLAHQINAIAPTVMAEAAQEQGALMVHLSTDYVFDGQKSRPYSEDDVPAPLGVYGQTKLAGELGIQQHCDRYVILRTAWVYGVYGKGNFVKTMLRLASQREELRVVADQVGTPTWAFNIAQAIATLLAAAISDDKTLNSEVQGIYHFTNSGIASWYDFAVAIVEEARSLGLPLQVEHIVPIPTTDYPTPAQRPAFSVLCNQKIQPLLGSPPKHWRNSLRRMLQQYHQRGLVN
ncbi:MAG TPA: dTDP-4-dehydrorhamnose reductase [Leptolyngbyaceae cyanobacterium]